MTILIQNMFEPFRLMLTWQPASGGSRFVVGELIRDSQDNVVFNYLLETEPFINAQAKGFQGFPAFDIKNRTHSNDVMQTFMRRLPPRRREDFLDYLNNFRLPETFNGSDFALLAYTGGKVAGDGFSFVPDLSSVKTPFDYVMEVAGTRYIIEEGRLNLNEIEIGDEVAFINEDDNPKDCNAIIVAKNQNRLGYVNQALCVALRHFAKTNKVSGVVVRKNGTPERPLVYVMLSVN
ncbi:hypothetical protein BD65_1883 [Yersinia ruckeri]|uniref:HIRAN domain-containing protein n=1 Tax=Yersinia ruckeri TaxID=29486 RepID=UPI0005AC040D|nr:HIRAN domain-containing protein [Yersinia ruckeri]AJI96701.1 hypothetical protein BD65_1883 [Yersinia ruckeri]